MTASPTGTIEHTPDGGRVRFERTLAFPIEEVWAAITEPERLGDWWPPMAAEITVDLREGGSIVFDWPDTDFPTMAFTLTHLEPPTLLEHTHTSPGSWMRWELEAQDGGTLLRATYSVPDIDMAIERGDLVGLHYSLDRLAQAPVVRRASVGPASPVGTVVPVATSGSRRSIITSETASARITKMNGAAESITAVCSASRPPA